jgi:hypothetical protein
MAEKPPVRIFRMGANHRFGLDYRPPHQVTYRPICLREGVRESQTLTHNKALTFEPPAAPAQPDSLPTTPNILSPACAHLRIRHAHRLETRRG